MQFASVFQGPSIKMRFSQQLLPQLVTKSAMKKEKSSKLCYDCQTHAVLSGHGKFFSETRYLHLR